MGVDGLSLNAKRTDQFDRNDLWDLMLKARLRFAQSYPQPVPAFIDGDTWRIWQSYDETTRSVHYLQPQIRQHEEVDSEGEEVVLQVLDNLKTDNLSAAKDWLSAQRNLQENEYSLSAGRYKPFSLERIKHDPPTQIIQELKQLENKIQLGLDELLAMIEGAV